MAALDISKSAFANTRELVFETPAMAEGGWRVHATNAIKTLSKVAVLAVLLVLTAVNTAHADDISTAPVASVVSAIQASQLVKKPFQRFNADIGVLYQASINSSNDINTWKSLRPNLNILGMYNGVAAYPGTLSQNAGVLPQDYVSDESKKHIKELNAGIEFNSKSKETPGAAIVIPNIFFKIAEKPAGAQCIISFNVHIADVHHDIKKATNWPDDVIRDMVIRHELTHCIETSDRTDRVIKILMNPEIKEGSMITPKSLKNIDLWILNNQSKILKNNTEGQARAAFLSSLEQLNKKSALRLESEEISDAIPILSLIKESRLDVSDITSYAQLRINDNDQDHETSSMLLNMQHQLEINPSVVLKWRQDHAKEFMQGKGLQINQLVNWVQPLWKAHSQARDDDRVSTTPSVVSIPGYN